MTNTGFDALADSDDRTGVTTDDSARDKDRLIEELRAAVRARDEFIAIAAHELRNPLTPVVMRLNSTLRLARATPGIPEQLVLRLQQTIASVEHYVRRLDLLLDATRVNSGNLRLDPTAVDLGELARIVAGAQAPMADHAGSKIILRTESVVGSWDRMALEQILQNLVSNAIKYGQGRPVTIAVGRRGDAALIEVRDEGPGIAAEDQRRIFRAFQRGPTGGQGGFGIGLWVTHRLIEAMGGSIDVDSAPGAGATFRVLLPLMARSE